MGKLKVLFAVGVVIFAICCYSRKSFDPAMVKGKNVVVTGASTGIGEQLAYQYAKLGANLIINARREQQLQDVAKKCRELGAPEVHVAVGDMGNETSRKKLVQIAKDKFGGLDYLILNHAYIPVGYFEGGKKDMDLVRETMEINFFAYVDLASSLLPLLTKNAGSIGVVSSVAGKIASPLMASYSANKFALQGFFGALRQEFAIKEENVSITLAVLGFIGTENALENIKEFNSNNDITWLKGSPELTALEIIHGTSLRVPEIHYPTHAKFFVTLNKFCPSLMEKLSASSINPPQKV